MWLPSDVKLCQRKPLFPFFRGPLFWDPFFLFFLSPAKVGSLEMQPGAKLQAYLGVTILQPHACAQRFRLRILRRTRSNAGRTSARSLSGRIESIWETPSKERAVGVQRLGVHAAPCRSKSGCPRCPQWEAESPTVDNSSSLFRGRFPNGFYSKRVPLS